MRQVILVSVIALGFGAPAAAQYPYPQCAENADVPMRNLVNGGKALLACMDEIEIQGEPLIQCDRYRTYRPILMDALKCRVEAVYFYGDAREKFPNYKPPEDQQFFMDKGAVISKIVKDNELTIRIKFPDYLPRDPSDR